MTRKGGLLAVASVLCVACGAQDANPSPGAETAGEPQALPCSDGGALPSDSVQVDAGVPQESQGDGSAGVEDATKSLDCAGVVRDGPVTYAGINDEAALEGVTCIRGDLILDIRVGGSFPTVFPTLATVTGDVVVQRALNDDAFQWYVLRFPALKRVGGSIRLHAHGVEFSALERARSIQIREGAREAYFPALETLDEDFTLAGTTTHVLPRVPRLRKVRSVYVLANLGSYDVVLPEVEVIERLEVVSNAELVDIGAAKLKSADAIVIRGNRRLGNLELTSLENVGTLEVEDSERLRTLSLPRLRAAQGISVQEHKLLREVALPDLRAAEQRVEFVGLPSLERLELPLLTGSYRTYPGEQGPKEVTTTSVRFERMSKLGRLNLPSLREAKAAIFNDLGVESLELPSLVGAARAKFNTMAKCTALSLPRFIGGGEMSVGGNRELRTLSMPAFWLAYFLEISGNPNLAQVSPMPKFSGTPGLELRIVENTSLPDLVAFSSLSILEQLSIGGNSSLESLEPVLSKLELVRRLDVQGQSKVRAIVLPRVEELREAQIQNNASLAELRAPALKRVDDVIEIGGNPLLPECYVERIRQNLDAQSGPGKVISQGTNPNGICAP